MARTINQQRRRLEEMIQRRIETTVKRAGVDIRDIQDLLDSELNGDIYWTESGRIKINKESYAKNAKHFEEKLPNVVPAYVALREDMREQEEFNRRTQSRHATSPTEISAPKIDNEFLHQKMKQHYSSKARALVLFEDRYEGDADDLDDSLNYNPDSLGWEIYMTYEEQLLADEASKKLSILGTQYNAGDYTSPEYIQALKDYEEARDKVLKIKARIAKEQGWMK